jgi:parallel beta-helix repeat protein
VVIVGETPNATITGYIVVNSGKMNVVLRSFKITDWGTAGGSAAVEDAGAYQLLIDGVTFDDGTTNQGVPAILVSGSAYQPEIRNCTFIMDNTSAAVIELDDGMNAKIHDNKVIGSGDNPDYFVYITKGGYPGLEVWNNTINYADQFIVVASGQQLVNAVIRDNDAGVLALSASGKYGIDLQGSTNVQILRNRFTIIGTAAPDIQYGIYVDGANVTIQGNTITAGSTYADDLINIAAGGTNALIEGNTLDARLGGGYGVYTTATNTTIRGNTILGTNGYAAIYVDAGATNAVIDANTIRNVKDANAISIYEMNATISGNVIDGVTGTSYNGIYLNVGNARILNNTIKNVDDGVGIYVDGVMNNVIQGNTLENIGQDGILLNGTGADNNTVKGNTLRKVALRAVVSTATDPAVGDYAAIRVQGDNNVLDGNIIEDVGGLVWPAWSCGIDIQQTGSRSPMNNSVLNNKIRQFTPSGNISSAAIGILVRAGMNHLVQGNELSNTGNMQIGIDIRTTDRMTVKENKVEGMVYAGLYLRGGTVTNRLTVEGNKLTNNYIGIMLSAGAADLTGNVVSGGWTSLLVDRFGVAGQYKLENNCFIKPTGVHVRNDGTGTLTAKKSYWEPTPPSVVGAVDTSDPLASCPGAPAPTPTLSKNYGPRAGWYMVSVPTTGDTAGIFGVTLYWWNGTTYTQYTGTAAIEPVKGYWANLPANKTVTASGTIPTTDQTVALVKGWNMISVPWAYPKAAIQVQKGTETKSWADAVAAGWVRDTIWGYDGAYQSVTTLDPWYGYWVRALVDGLSLKFAYASRLTTLCVSCLEAKAVVPEGEELPPAPPAASAAEFTFVNVPNPIRDVHTTTFKVLGPLSSMVTEIKVQVFDLTGKLVWEGTAAGAELTWHTDDLTGVYLANGVYLYKVYVKVGDAWISSGVLKLVIQR